MRLVQLAVKLGINQNEVITFLQHKGIIIPDNGNIKIEDEHVNLVLNHFEKPETQPLTTEQIGDVAQVSNAEEAPVQSEITTVGSDEKDQAIEVIRAKKIKLEGIKVLGKIDLPEPARQSKGKEKPEDKRTKKAKAGAQNRKSKERLKGKTGYKSASKSKTKETYQQKLKREEKEAKKRQRELEKQIKEKKKRHYEKQLQAAPAQPKKKSPKKISPTVPQKQTVVRHKNPIRRLWAWLNGKYD